MTTYKTPKMRRLLVQMPPSYHDDVKAHAGRLGISVSELVRIAVSHWTVCEQGEAAFREMLIARLADAEVESE